MRIILVVSVLLVGAVLCEERNEKSGSRISEEKRQQTQLFSADLGNLAQNERKEDKKKEEDTWSRRGEHEQQEKPKSKPALDEQSKQALLVGKSEDLLFSKLIDFFVNNPNTKAERECFAKIKPGESIDFVIDLAPSPSLDKVDKLIAESPAALYMQRQFRSATRAFFGAVELFIELVTYDMKPEATHSVIYEKGRKYFIRGKAVDASIKEHVGGGEFNDQRRNLLTMWPIPTKSVPETFLSRIVKNNLGRMTRLSLMNRDNGLPTVLAGKRHSKPVYTVVITDGASGAKIQDLTDDLSRTTLIDLGNHRFIKNVPWSDLKQLASYVTLGAPQQLLLLSDTTRMMACSYCCPAEQSRD